MLHRLTIRNNVAHDIIEKKNYLVFVINHAGRRYFLSNLNSKLIDYDILDKVIKGIPIDTKKD